MKLKPFTGNLDTDTLPYSPAAPAAKLTPFSGNMETDTVPVEEQPTADQHPTWGDFGAGVMRGFANIPVTGGRIVSWGGRKLGMPAVEEAGRYFADDLSSASDYWTNLMTPAGKNPQGIIDKAGMAIGESIPGVMAMAPPAKLGAMGMEALGVGGKVASGLGSIGVPAARAARIGEASTTAIPAAVSEGLFSGGQAADQTYREAMAAPKAKLDRSEEYKLALEKSSGDGQKARRLLADLASDAALERTAPWTGGVSLVTGGGILGTLAGKEKPGIIPGIVGGIRSEAPQEAIQSGGEQAIQNMTAREYYDPSRLPHEGVGEAMAVGGISGGAMGGAFGGWHGGMSRNEGEEKSGPEQQRPTPPSVQRTPPAPPAPEPLYPGETRADSASAFVAMSQVHPDTARAQARANSYDPDEFTRWRDTALDSKMARADGDIKAVRSSGDFHPAQVDEWLSGLRGDAAFTRMAALSPAGADKLAVSLGVDPKDYSQWKDNAFSEAYNASGGDVSALKRAGYNPAQVDDWNKNRVSAYERKVPPSIREAGSTGEQPSSDDIGNQPPKRPAGSTDVGGQPQPVPQSQGVPGAVVQPQSDDIGGLVNRSTKDWSVADLMAFANNRVVTALDFSGAAVKSATSKSWQYIATPVTGTTQSLVYARPGVNGGSVMDRLFDGVTPSVAISGTERPAVVEFGEDGSIAKVVSKGAVSLPGRESAQQPTAEPVAKPVAEPAQPAAITQDALDYLSSASEGMPFQWTRNVERIATENGYPEDAPRDPGSFINFLNGRLQERNFAQAPPNPVDRDVKLPEWLKNGGKDYNYGSKKFTLDFASDLDKAAYIIANPDKLSKRDSDYLSFFMQNTGLSEEESRRYGGIVRDSIKKLARDAKPGSLAIPSNQIPTTKKRPNASKAAKNPVAQPAGTAAQAPGQIPAEGGGVPAAAEAVGTPQAPAVPLPGYGGPSQTGTEGQPGQVAAKSDYDVSEKPGDVVSKPEVDKALEKALSVEDNVAEKPEDKTAAGQQPGETPEEEQAPAPTPKKPRPAKKSKTAKADELAEKFESSPDMQDAANGLVLDVKGLRLLDDAGNTVAEVDAGAAFKAIQSDRDKLKRLFNKIVACHKR